jgi:16S rRNA (uracil1498-N3)-methyltransferase
VFTLNQQHPILRCVNIILFETDKKDNFIELTDFRASHILKVLKLKVGDTFKAGQINKFVGIAEIIAIDNNYIHYKWVEKEKATGENQITLIVGLVRPISMKRILRESGMFGIENIVVVGTDLGERSYKEAKLYKEGTYKKYLLDGAMQAGIATLPNFYLYDKLDNALSEIDSKSSKIIFDNVKGIKQIRDKKKFEDKVVIAIGSERGWSDKERQLFERESFDFFSMGRYILRTETACCSALALVLSTMGQL